MKRMRVITAWNIVIWILCHEIRPDRVPVTDSNQCHVATVALLIRKDKRIEMNRDLTKEYELMKKAVIFPLVAIVLGYIGSVLGDEFMNWPQLGPILAIVVMGAAILTSLEKDK